MAAAGLSGYTDELPEIEKAMESAIRVKAKPDKAAVIRETLIKTCEKTAH
jgi:hypothetical protein